MHDRLRRRIDVESDRDLLGRTVRVTEIQDSLVGTQCHVEGDNVDGQDRRCVRGQQATGGRDIEPGSAVCGGTRAPVQILSTVILNNYRLACWTLRGRATEGQRGG